MPNTPCDSVANSADMTSPNDKVFVSTYQKEPSVGADFLPSAAVYARALHALSLAAGTGVRPLSMHGVFVEEASARLPTSFFVTRKPPNGRNETRAVQDRQEGRIVFAGIATFAAALDFSSAVRNAKVPKFKQPSALRDVATLHGYRLGEREDAHLTREVKRIEVRPLDPAAWFALDEGEQQTRRCWLRCAQPMDAIDEHSLLVFFFGLCGRAGDHKPAAQTLHFHQPTFRPAEWLLAEVKTTNAASSRPFVSCSFWNENGELIATATKAASAEAVEARAKV
ncbi:Acyl-CoA thioesterase 2 [Aphelenchoides fujianensis]|nr:Acyl-CoA thioesterase 2 [Aphelenchoides fujianensis]